MKKIIISSAFTVFTLLLSAQKKTVQKPNILWITCEDISPTLSFYGDHTAKTPHLDALAKESMVYENAFATTPVCGPSRSAIITGMLPTSIGTMHMRTGKDVMGWSKDKYAEKVFDHYGNQVFDLNNQPIREYAAVIPAEIKTFTEFLRANGYYCTNSPKTDYQFAAPQTAWDENGDKAHWRNTPKDMPFFSILNIGDTHESRIWEYKNLPLTVDPKSVPLPDYYPDNEIIRTDVARLYSNIELMDKKVGNIIAQLKEDGLYDNTIIFFFSDHGGPLPKQKREPADSGLKVPLMIRFPNATLMGRTDDLVSFADLAPTMLSLANIKPPKYMEGQAFLGKFKAKPREVIYANADRFDEFTDRIRVVRDKNFLYVKNYFLNIPKYKNVSYRLKMNLMNAILEVKNQNKLNENQQYWFSPKASEELYDVKNDPYQLHNLATDPNYQSQLLKLRTLCQNQFDKKKDFGAINEGELISEMWPNNNQPKTENVVVNSKNGLVSLSSKTTGASIAFIEIDINSNEKLTKNSAWKLYTKPFLPTKGKKIIAKAIRIGFLESDSIEFRN